MSTAAGSGLSATSPRGQGAVPSLADLIPAVGAALGVPLADETGVAPRLVLPTARHAVVVMLDGLGEHLLARRAGHAPFLANAPRTVLTSGFPSTTATSLAMLGTGRWPGAHGLVGTEVLDPDRGVLFNELLWDPLVDPHAWQPDPTAFEQLDRLGVDVVRIGPAYFEGSGLTTAGLRGGRFVAARSLAERVRSTLSALGRAKRPTLVYLYWGDIDKIGHEHGCESWQWGSELESVDGELAGMCRRLSTDVLVAITADHGMVDVPMAARVDLAHEPALRGGVRYLGGDPRGAHVYCEPGAASDVLAAWRSRLGGQWQVYSREEAIERGLFGVVVDRVLPRIGDVIATAVEDVAVVDSRRMRPEVLALKGLHGAATPTEQLVPLILPTR